MKRYLGLVLILCLLFAQSTYAVLTKTDAAVDEWAAVAQNTLREGAEIDLNTTPLYRSVLHISVAQTSATLHVASSVEVQVSREATGSGDENWTTLTKRNVLGGTANPEALGGAEAAGQTVLEVTSTTGYEAEGARWILLLDNVVATSEFLYLVSHEGTPSVTVMDGTANAHDASDTLYNIAENFPITIPIEFKRARVIYDNTADADGSQIHTKCSISKIPTL